MTFSATIETGKNKPGETPPGFVLFRYRCAVSGCFNDKHRLKFDVFYRSLPGRLSFSDIDGITEIDGNGLILEWKAEPGELPAGQRIMFERLTKGEKLSVLCVAGDASTMSATHVAKCFNGKWWPWTPAGTEDVCRSIGLWAAWAKANPRFR